MGNVAAMAGDDDRDDSGGYYDEFHDLRRAVEALYFSAHWYPDRECDANGLWQAVRDAANIQPGQTASRLGAPRGPLPEKAA